MRIPFGTFTDGNTSTIGDDTSTSIADTSVTSIADTSNTKIDMSTKGHTEIPQITTTYIEYLTKLIPPSIAEPLKSGSINHDFEFIEIQSGEKSAIFTCNSEIKFRESVDREYVAITQEQELYDMIKRKFTIKLGIKQNREIALNDNWQITNPFNQTDFESNVCIPPSLPSDNRKFMRFIAQKLPGKITCECGVKRCPLDRKSFSCSSCHTLKHVKCYGRGDFYNVICLSCNNQIVNYQYLICLRGILATLLNGRRHRLNQLNLANNYGLIVVRFLIEFGILHKSTCQIALSGRIFSLNCEFEDSLSESFFVSLTPNHISSISNLSSSLGSSIYSRLINPDGLRQMLVEGGLLSAQTRPNTTL